MAFLTTLALSLIFVTAAAANDEPVVTIPLDQIWALDMPGTLSMDKLVPNYDANSWRNLRKLLTPKQLSKKAAKGFVIALKQNWPNELDKINQILHFSRRSNSVPVTEEIGIVFYSKASAYRVEIEKVERRDSVVEIRYRLAPHQSATPSKKTSVDLALIPLGMLPVGEYRVEMTRSPMEKAHLDFGHKPISDELANRFVCQPFTFEVWGLPQPDPGLSESAIEIPLDQIWMLNVPGNRNIRQNLDWKQLPQPFTLLSTGSLEPLFRLEKNRAEPGFVVAGKGQDALTAAHEKLPEGEKPSNVLPEGTEITVVYFSHAYGPIDLYRVERKENVIEVRYRFNPGGSGILSQQLALMPLGKLPVGEYRVNMIEVPPTTRQEVSPSWLVEAHLRVCQSFSFSIVDVIEEEK